MHPGTGKLGNGLRNQPCCTVAMGNLPMLEASLQLDHAAYTSYSVLLKAAHSPFLGMPERTLLTTLPDPAFYISASN